MGGLVDTVQFNPGYYEVQKYYVLLFSFIFFLFYAGLGVFCPILRLRFSKTFFFFFHAFWGVLGVAATVHALFNEQ